MDKYLVEGSTEGGDRLFSVDPTEQIEILEVLFKRDKEILFCRWLDAGTGCPDIQKLHSTLGSLF